MTARYIVGDVHDVMSTIPDGSIDLVLTSPPFLALRSYLPDDHPLKAKEIGSEPDPATFIDVLLGLTAEWRRVLAPHGSIAIELGDSYSGSGGAGGDYAENGWRDGQPKAGGSGRLARYNDQRGNPAGMRDATFQGANTRTGGGSGWPLAKCKAMIPELYRVALAYGINPLTGQPSPAGRWRVRNVVSWCRPNPPVGALGDKFRCATSDLVIACVSDKRWFDLDSVRTAPLRENNNNLNTTKRIIDGRGDSGQKFTTDANPAGAPPLDYWVISPTGYSGSHYAVFPKELCRIPIESMCPRQVCRTCGEPSRRISDIKHCITGETGRARGKGSPDAGADMTRVKNSDVETLGWSHCACHQDQGCRPTTWRTVVAAVLDDQLAPVLKANGQPKVKRQTAVDDLGHCEHDHHRPGIVLDPFGGSGTTGAVASGMGRDSILIDIDETNAWLARERVGLFLDIEYHAAEAIA